MGYLLDKTSARLAFCLQVIVQQPFLQLLRLEQIRYFQSQCFPIPRHILPLNPSMHPLQAMIQVYLLFAILAKHFQLLVLLYRLEDLILRLSQSNRFPHIDSWYANLQSGHHLMLMATFLPLPLISVALQHCQLHLAGRRDPEKSVLSSHASFFYLVPAECAKENSICWEKTYLGFYNLFVVCLGRCSLLSVFRRLRNSFLCLL